MNSSAQRQLALRWQADWRTSLFTAVLLPLLVGLGLWQLQRAAEKEQIEQVWSERRILPPGALPPPGTAPEELSYRRVELRGVFLAERQFLLDNSMRQGRYGLEVLTPFRPLEGGAVVLINRGWVAGDPARRSLPELSTPPGIRSLNGTIYVPPGAPYTLGPETDTGAWPRTLQSLDTHAISAMLGEAIYPYSVRLETGSDAALDTDWPLLNSSAEKHRAYAVQWFSMAAVLLCLYLVRSTNLLRWLSALRGRRHG